MPALLALIDGGAPAPCGGADTDANGVIDGNDLLRTVAALFDTSTMQ